MAAASVPPAEPPPCGTDTIVGPGLATLAGMDMGTVGRVLLVVGLVVAAAGGFLALGGRLPFGQLPGDVSIRGRDGGVFVPIASCIVLSIVLTVVLNIIIRR